MNYLQKQTKLYYQIANILQSMQIQLELLEENKNCNYPILREKTEKIIHDNLDKLKDQYETLITQTENIFERNAVICQREDMVTIAEGFKYPVDLLINLS